MKALLVVEELFLLLLSLFALGYFKVEWWYYLLLFIGPDISMIGYLLGNRAGAILYNIFHHQALAVIIFIAGFITQAETAQVIGIIFFGHSSMDRNVGYGLKHFQGFQYTNLGVIGNIKEVKIHKERRLS